MDLSKVLRNVSCITLFVISPLTTKVALAGGYLAVDNTGNPYRWNGPVTLHLDQGPLGELTKSQADALVFESVAEWTAPKIPGSSLQFIKGPDLVEDHGDGLGTDPNYDRTSASLDTITAVIYDQFGYLTEGLGSGQSNNIVGYAGPEIPDDYSPAPISEGLLVLNGKFTDGIQNENNPEDKPIETYRGVITHETGHLLNLDHSQTAIAFTETGFDVGSIGGPYEQRYPPDFSGVPTMFPFVLPEMESLSADDKAWILDLYSDTQTQTANGTISGAIRTFDDLPQNGINVVAYSVDDHTSMVSCISGFSDVDPDTSPTGTYLIPSLPPGSKWIVDVEPVVDIFYSLTGIGPLDVPATFPGPPEFINEPGFEAAFDDATVSTTFDFPDEIPARQYNNIDLRFNDIGDFNVVPEVDLGTDELTAAFVAVTPGKYTIITGQIDPDEPNPQPLGDLGSYYDFYRVKCPAGVELNQIFIDTQGSSLEVIVLEQKNDGDTHMIASTAAILGFESVGLYIDSSRMGDEPHKGIYYFAVGYSIDLPWFKQLSDYSLGMLYSVSDRDPLAVSGTSDGFINPDAGVLRIKGRGFKNIGGPPAVEFSSPGIQAGIVSFVDSTTLDVTVTKLPDFIIDSPVTVQVTNSPESGGYGGRIRQRVVSESHISDWELYE